MQLVILAAGKGTRMEPVTHKIPKPMVPLLGKPKLEWTLENLPSEIDEVLIVINHLGKQIEDHFGDEFCGKPIKYVLQEKLDGTSHSVDCDRRRLGDDEKPCT